ncbi:hypothetical protein [Streptomyces scopuliridis]|uniref:Uncharacterized protein n=1 Tax=Streptomyces scopuliridis RB72 TaxID=1440053 RepID=A0A2T7TFB2_9ACTN|nr:hypothetical protein [Streptomyces scopuliridis]PVE13839.1 hypothetical protein Y717_07995 [Streptomyces scopuliridis RB72]
MSRAARGRPQWLIELAPDRSPRREQGGQLTLPLGIVHLGEPVATARLTLTVAEAEQLHAALCYALNGEPVPDDAPECRKPIQYAGGRPRF